MGCIYIIDDTTNNISRIISVHYKMNIRQTQISNRIYANSCISMCINELNEVVFSVDKPNDIMIRLSFSIMSLACMEANHIIDFLRVLYDVTPIDIYKYKLMHRYDPRTDWALFAPFNYCDHDLFTSYAERNTMNIKDLKKEIYRDLLIDFISIFEKLETCPLFKMTDYSFMDDVSDCLYLYREHRTQHEAYLASIRIFCLIRTKSMRHIASTYKTIGSPEKWIVSKVASLGSNPMRRTLEYVY